MKSNTVSFIQVPILNYYFSSWKLIIKSKLLYKSIYQVSYRMWLQFVYLGLAYCFPIYAIHGDKIYANDVNKVLNKTGYRYGFIDRLESEWEENTNKIT